MQQVALNNRSGHEMTHQDEIRKGTKRGRFSRKNRSFRIYFFPQSVILCVNVCVLFSGVAEQECVYATIPFWRILLVPEAERTRMSEHHLDFRVCGSAPPRKDRQLHSHFLRSDVVNLGASRV